jgi:hypothetical protein
MNDIGLYRNSAYVYGVKNLPKGKKLVQSKKPSDWDNSGEPLNKAFHCFGSKTNIRESLDLKNSKDKNSKSSSNG